MAFDRTASTDLVSDDGHGAAAIGRGWVFVMAIAIGAALGVLAPETGAAVAQGTDITLMVMIGLLFFELRPDTLARAFGNLKFLSIAWGANFVLIPVVGLAIASLIFEPGSVLFIGLMLYFLAPCTDWFLGFTRMAQGDVERGAALIPINLISQLLLLPLWLWLLTSHQSFAAPGSIPGLLAQWFVLPLLVAQGARFAISAAFGAPRTAQIAAHAGTLVPWVLLVLIVQIFGANIGTIAADARVFGLVAVAVFLFFAATFLLGQVIARYARLDYPQHALLSMTMAARNAPLMLAVTAVAIPDQPLLLAVIIVGMLVELPQLALLKHILLKQRLMKQPAVAWAPDPRTAP
ncbi:MAG: arsenic resistance protein [Pseudomonadota bacterium]